MFCEVKKQWRNLACNFVLDFEYPKEEDGTSKERCVSTGWQQKN